MGQAQRSHSSIAAYAAMDFLLCAVFVYGYIYTAYKYGNPLFGRNDFFKYKEIVGDPFDYSATTAPFVLRQIPGIVASIFYKLGVHYDTKTVTDLIGMDADTKRRFLALILSNALAVCLSFTILAGYLRRKLTRTGILDAFALFGIFAAWFYFPTVAIAPVTVGWGWFASSLFVIAFVERSFTLTCLACLVALFSRETTLVFALVLFSAQLMFADGRRREVLMPVLVLLASCAAYLVLRKVFTTGYDHQIAPQAIAASLIPVSIGPVAGAAGPAPVVHCPEAAALRRIARVGRRRRDACCFRRQRRSDRHAVG
jgi:hypothetical protein